MYASAWRLALVCAIFGGALSACGPSADPFDVLIVGGEIIDGTGADRFRADVGIRGDRIVLIGNAENSTAIETVDASGKIVAPGFIDVHNHTLDIVVEDEWQGPQINAQFLTQGVTSILTGADGFWSPADIRTIKDRLGAQGSGVNYACYVGHNGVRDAVMKDDQQRQPSSEELDAMRKEVREGMEEGCVGLSTGLMYEPGMFSETFEVIELARVVGAFGGTYDSHVRDPAHNLVKSDEEAIEIGRAAGISPKIAHIKAVGLQNRGRTADIINLVQAARAEGIDVVSDQYPYNSAATHVLHELILFPGIYDYHEKFDRGEIDEAGIMEVIREQLQDESRRDELKGYAENGLNGGFTWIKMAGYGSMRILVSEEDRELEDRNIQLLAQERGIDPFDLVVDLILDYEKPLLVTFGSIEEEDVQELLVQPWNMVASDGFHVGPEQKDSSGHPRSTGSFTRVLGHYSRDLGLLSLESAVHKMTALPADHLGLVGRGRIEVGSVADIVVFDADNVIDRSTWSDPNAYSTGIEYVLVNGLVALANGEVTGTAAGRFLPKSSAEN